MNKRTKETRTFDNTTNFGIEMPSMRIIEKIMVAGQNNPFVSQLYSVLISRRIDENIKNAPINFVVCIDLFKVKKVFELSEIGYEPDNLSLLIIGMIDSVIAASNIARESLNHNLGIFYAGNSLERVKMLKKSWNLPDLVIPFITVAVGYPEDEPISHYKFPSQYIYFEDEYKSDDIFHVSDLMQKLDDNQKLINYYNQITTRSYGNNKKLDTWLDLLKFNCEHWKIMKDELLEVFEFCGLKLSV